MLFSIFVAEYFEVAPTRIIHRGDPAGDNPIDSAKVGQPNQDREVLFFFEAAR